MQRVQSRLDDKIKVTYDDIIFELGTDWATVIREALMAYLPALEQRAKIVKERKYPRSPMSQV